MNPQVVDILKELTLAVKDLTGRLIALEDRVSALEPKPRFKPESSDGYGCYGHWWKLEKKP